MNDQWEMKIAGPTAHHGGLEEVSGSGLRRRRFPIHLAHNWRTGLPKTPMK